MIETIYREAVREMEIPGFRRGRIPRSFLEARFGKDFFYEDAQARLVNEHLPQVLEELELEPVAEPEFEVIEFEEGKPFRFEVTVEILPEIQVADYQGVEIEEIPLQPIEESELEAALERLRRAHGWTVPKAVGEVVEDGDVMLIQEQMVLDDEPGKTEERELVVSEDSRFGKQLMGMRVGDEREIELQLGEETYRSRVKLVSLKRVELPELDNAFAVDHGYEHLEALTRAIRDDLEVSTRERQRAEMQLKLLDKIVEMTEINVPERLRDGMAKQDLEDLKQMIGYSATAYSSFEEFLEQEETTEETVAGDYREQAELQIKRELVLETIKKAEGLELSGPALDDLIEKEAVRLDQNPIKFKNEMRAKPEELERFQRRKETERILDFLYEQAKIVPAPVPEAEQEQKEGTTEE